MKSVFLQSFLQRNITMNPLKLSSLKNDAEEDTVFVELASRAGQVSVSSLLKQKQPFKHLKIDLETY